MGKSSNDNLSQSAKEAKIAPQNKGAQTPIENLERAVLGENIDSNIIAPSKPIFKNRVYISGYFKDVFEVKKGVGEQKMQDEKVEIKKISPYERFVISYLTFRQVKDENILKEVLENEELKELYEKLKDLEFKGKRESKEYLELKFNLEDKLLGIIKKVKVIDIEDVDEAEKFFKLIFNLEKKRVIANKLLELEGKDELIQQWETQINELNTLYLEEKITEEEYLEKMDAIFGRVVEESGDKEIMELWEAFKKVEKEEEKGNKGGDEKVVIGENEKVVKDENEIEKALGFANDDVKFDDITNKGNGTVLVIKSGISLNITITKDSKTGKFVYYVFYDDLNGKAKGVEKEKFLETFDGSMIDCFISKKMKSMLNGSELVSEIPDKDLIKLGKKLIGKGKDREYKIVGENFRVIEELVKLLSITDNKRPSLKEKITLLNDAIKTSNDSRDIRKRLLEGNVKSLDEVLGDIVL